MKNEMIKQHIIKLEEAYNSNAFTCLGEILALEAKMVTSDGKKCGNRKEIVRYFQALCESQWLNQVGETAACAVDDQGEDVLAILHDDLKAIKEVLRIETDETGLIAKMQFCLADQKKIELRDESVLDRNGLYLRALFPILQMYEASGYRVVWLSNKIDSEISLSLTKEGKMTYVNITAGMWPLCGPARHAEYVKSFNMNPENANTPFLLLSACLSNRTDLQNRRWYRGKKDVLELDYDIVAGSLATDYAQEPAVIELKDSEECALWN